MSADAAVQRIHDEMRKRAESILAGERRYYGWEAVLASDVLELLDEVEHRLPDSNGCERP